MNKKFIILIVVILLFIIVGSTFLKMNRSKRNNNTNSGNIISEEKSVNVGEYEVVSLADKKVIENKKEGFVASIPLGWNIKKYNEELDLFSPEIKFNQYGNVSPESLKEKKGCGIGIAISNAKKIGIGMPTRAEIISNRIAEAQKDPKGFAEKGYKVIEVNNRLALESVVKRNNQEIPISVEIPVGNKIYSFSNSLMFSNGCYQSFNNFLKGVKIK